MKLRGWKRALAVMLFLAMVCLPGACAADGESTTPPAESPTAGNGQPQDSAEGDGAQTGGNSGETGESSSPSIRERYGEILLNHGNFLSTDLNQKELSLADIREVVSNDDSITANAGKFTVIDLDADGENELVLWLQVNGASDFGFEILHENDGEIYGYTLPYRAFMSLKTDGTFEFAGGSADTGVGRLKFPDGGCTTEDLVYSHSEPDSAGEIAVQYFAGEESCTEEEFHAAVSQQQEKPDVEWYELTQDGVDSAFETAF